ncbi:MAG: hypothetical protein MJ198_06990 [Bacteroidales bacterium]|nr:hypothetical protein [Bacteroidales bacterium]
MKKFLSKILLFLILLFISSLALDIYISLQTQSSEDYKYKTWNEILKGDLSNDIVIMGSSRAYTQYSPRILDSTLHKSSYNLGINGCSVDRQIPRFSLYCVKNQKPQLVIQNIDWVATLDQTPDYEMEQYFPFFYNFDFRKNVISTLFSFPEKNIPLYRYLKNSNLWDSYKTSQHVFLKIEYKGFSGVSQNWNGNNFSKIDSITFKSDSVVIKEFCDYLQNCLDNDITVLFVYSPVYYKANERVTNISEMYSTFETIANKYHIQILDYSDCYISKDTTYFYNATHLNKNGAELFSNMLAHDMDSLQILH